MMALSYSFLTLGLISWQGDPVGQSPISLTSSPNFIIASVRCNDYKLLKLLLEKWFVIASKTHYKKHFCVFTLEHGY